MNDDTADIGTVHPSLGNLNLPASAADSPAFHGAFMDNLPESAKQQLSQMFLSKLLDKTMDLLDKERAKVKELEARLGQEDAEPEPAEQVGTGKKNPAIQIALRIPPDVLERWKATGPGWQTRMVQRLSAP